MRLVKILFLMITLLSVSLAQAAEVVLLDSVHTKKADSKPYPAFSAQKRVKDLFDFKSYGSYGDDRSGMITGTLRNSLEYTDVGGNKSKSFYEDDRLFYQTDLGLQLYEKLWGTYDLEGIIDLRLTNNERVEFMEAVRLKQLNLKVSNLDNLFEFGNFYSDFSTFTMGSSLEGFNVEIAPENSKYAFKSVLARLQKAEIGQYQRNTYGAHIDVKPFKKENDVIDSILRFGFQAVSTSDDTSSEVHDDVMAVAMQNMVISTDGEWRHVTNGLSANWELAYSEYNQDRNDLSFKRVNDTAFKFSPAYRYRNLFDVRYLYYHVEPDFFTATGSAVQDKKQHQINANYTFSKNYIFSFTNNWYWDNLSGSSKTMRTTNHEQYLSLVARPFEGRASFSMRPYINRFRRDSDDAANSASSHTTIYGVSVNDQIAKAHVGTFVEFRDFRDKSGNGNSEKYARYGANFSRDFTIYERPLFFSAGYNGSIRNPSSEGDDEVQNGLNFNGRFKISDPATLNFGHNFLTTDSSGNIDDYDTNTSFVEYKYNFKDTRKTELSLRGEYNDYNYETNSEDYQENRFTASLVTHF